MSVTAGALVGCIVALVVLLRLVFILRDERNAWRLKYELLADDVADDDPGLFEFMCKSVTSFEHRYGDHSVSTGAHSVKHADLRTAVRKLRAIQQADRAIGP